MFQSAIFSAVGSIAGGIVLIYMLRHSFLATIAAEGLAKIREKELAIKAITSRPYSKGYCAPWWHLVLRAIILLGMLGSAAYLAVTAP